MCEGGWGAGRGGEGGFRWVEGGGGGVLRGLTTSLVLVLADVAVFQFVFLIAFRCRRRVHDVFIYSCVMMCL